MIQCSKIKIWKIQINIMEFIKFQISGIVLEKIQFDICVGIEIRKVEIHKIKAQENCVLKIKYFEEQNFEKYNFKNI